MIGLYRLRTTSRKLYQCWALAFHEDKAKTYFPEEPRKAPITVFWELLLWLIRYGEVNKYYYVYGQDRKDTQNRNVVAWPVFKAMQDSRNLGAGKNYQRSFNYLCLLRDKLIFARYASSIGIPVPAIVAVISEDRVDWTEPPEQIEERLQLGQSRGVELFCKPICGIMGENAFPVILTDGELFHKANGSDAKPAVIDRLVTKTGYRFILQEKVRQHRKLSALHPHSLNTIRIVTFRNASNVELFSLALRVGANGRPTDNWASGGIVIRVNPDTGRLQGEGFFKCGFGGRVRAHPDTGVEFDGLQIPFFDEAVRMAEAFHRELYGIHSVGWDLAITENGPIVLEGNDDWDGAIPMTLEEDFRDRFLAMYRDAS
jgi:hypothetical protein